MTPAIDIISIPYKKTFFFSSLTSPFLHTIENLSITYINLIYAFSTSDIGNCSAFWDTKISSLTTPLKREGKFYDNPCIEGHFQVDHSSRLLCHLVVSGTLPEHFEMFSHQTKTAKLVSSVLQ